MCMITDHRNTRELLTGALEALHRANAGATNDLTEAGVLVSTGKIGIGSMSARAECCRSAQKKEEKNQVSSDIQEAERVKRESGRERIQK